MGNVSVQVSETFARLMTAAMLGMELEEVEGEEVNDVIGEVSNMVGGHLKSRFCDSGFPCDLSIPSITSGKNFKIESKNWARHERIAFCHEAHVALVEVFIKASN
jgi:chemotaxis protein CheX